MLSHCLGDLGNARPDDFPFQLGCGEIDVQVQTATFECVRKISRVVTRQKYQWLRATFERPQLRNRYLEVREDLEE